MERDDLVDAALAWVQGLHSSRVAFSGTCYDEATRRALAERLVDEIIAPILERLPQPETPPEPVRHLLGGIDDDFPPGATACGITHGGLTVYDPRRVTCERCKGSRHYQQQAARWQAMSGSAAQL